MREKKNEAIMMRKDHPAIKTTNHHS